MTTSLHTFEELPSMRMLMLRAAVPSGRGPLRDGATIPRIETTVPRVLILPKALAAYREVCGFVPGDRVPPTWLQVLAGPLHMAILADKAFPLPAMGVVHVRNRIDQFEPVQVGDTIGLSAWVQGHRPAKRGVEFDLVTEARRGGATIWRSEATVLSMAGHKAGGSPKKREKPAITGESPDRTHSVIWKVPEDQGRRYSQISGDRNPIHLHALSAKLFGFKRAIVHGMWSLARCLAELEDDMPEVGTRVDVQFRRPVFLPSRVLFSAGPATGDDVQFAVRTPDASKVHLEGLITSAQTDDT